MSNASDDNNQNWAPEAWNFHGTPQAVLESLKIKAAARNNFSPYEIGTDAGRFVLDQYYAAKGDTNKGAAAKSFLSFQSLNNASAIMLSLGGLVAALGVDYQIFGSAAKGMTMEKLPFDLNAFAVGSLIFAGGLGLTEKFNNKPKKAAMYATLIVASIGASFLAADSKEFRQKFTNTLAAKFDRGSNEDQKKIDKLTAEINAINQKIQENRVRLSTGGVGGKPILADGFPGNDEEGRKILESNLTLEGDVIQKSAALGQANADFKVSTEKDPVDLYGRLAATAYIGAWLIAAQLLVAEVVRRAGKTFSDFRQSKTKQPMQKKFLEGIENPDETIRKDAIHSATHAAISKISEVLSAAQMEAGKPDKVNENFAKLFEENNYAKMVEVAEGIVFQGIIVKPRRSLRDFFQDAFGSRWRPQNFAGTAQPNNSADEHPQTPSV